MSSHSRPPEEAGASPDFDPDISSVRHNASVLNTNALTEEATRILAASEAGLAIVEDLHHGDYEVADDLVGYNVYPKARVIHRLKDDEPGEFDGWFIGEEWHGLNHPLLLLSPDRVFVRGTKPSRF